MPKLTRLLRNPTLLIPKLLPRPFLATRTCKFHSTPPPPPPSQEHQARAVNVSIKALGKSQKSKLKRDQSVVGLQRNAADTFSSLRSLSNDAGKSQHLSVSEMAPSMDAVINSQLLSDDQKREKLLELSRELEHRLLLIENAHNVPGLLNLIAQTRRPKMSINVRGAQARLDYISRYQISFTHHLQHLCKLRSLPMEKIEAARSCIYKSVSRLHHRRKNVPWIVVDSRSDPDEEEGEGAKKDQDQAGLMGMRRRTERRRSKRLYTGVKTKEQSILDYVNPRLGPERATAVEAYFRFAAKPYYFVDQEGVVAEVSFDKDGDMQVKSLAGDIINEAIENGGKWD